MWKGQICDSEAQIVFLSIALRAGSKIYSHLLAATLELSLSKVNGKF